MQARIQLVYQVLESRQPRGIGDSGAAEKDDTPVLVRLQQPLRYVWTTLYELHAIYAGLVILMYIVWLSRTERARPRSAIDAVLRFELLVVLSRLGGRFGAKNRLDFAV